MTMLSSDSNGIVESELKRRLQAIESVVDADAITYLGPILDSTPMAFKIMVEGINSRKKKLFVLLETEGGYVEAAERVVNILRHHYKYVDFVVTSHAMSAGTVLVMSGDDIYMDYSAMLGPIDPQLGRPGAGTLIPALGYLEQYDRLIERSASGEMTSAELAYLIEKFDPAELYQYEQARDLSIALLTEWLVKYKFKNWKITSSSQRRVTSKMKRGRAEEIARLLNDTSRWHSHNRGISMEVARKTLNLRIEDVADTPKLQETLADYNALLYDYRMRRGHDIVLNWAGGYHGH